MGLGDLGNSQLLQIGGDVESRDSLSGRILWREAKCVAGQPFGYALEGSKDQSIHSHRGLLEEIRHVTHGSPQLLQQNPETEMGPTRKYLWRSLLSNGVTYMPVTYMGDPRINS